MTEVLRTSWRKFSHDTEEPPVNSAVDLLIQREVQMAKKENRNVKYDTQVIRDELLGFYLAGHETTSTTLCRAFKHLTKHQEMQHKLRQALHSAHGLAFTEDRLPTPEEIVRANVPYLDAFIEENHRLGQAIPTVIRRTTRDAIVLGHKIPKGTDVFMLMNGPDFRSRGFHVEEDIRSSESRESKSRYGVWDESDIAEFKPERYIKRNANGPLVFDPFTGPVLPYGAGLRGCFGKQTLSSMHPVQTHTVLIHIIIGIKLAVIELKVIVTMVVWSFELHETPLELSSFKGYDVNTHRAQQTYLRLVRTKREL